MSRKKKRRAHVPGHPTPAPSPPRFLAGALVRVKAGTPDPDFPDIPLGGWSGAVADIDTGSVPLLYLIKWNTDTLNHMHPLYRQRCDREGLDPANCWLSEAELELADDTPLAMEQPTVIQARPLSMSDQGDRLRSVFGLTSDDPVPPVDAEHVVRYHAYLRQELAFPFNAELWEQPGEANPGRKNIVTAYNLLDVADWEDGLEVEAGSADEKMIVPLADLDDVRDFKARQLVQDYSYWFHMWNAAPARERPGPVTLGGMLKTTMLGAVYGMGFGAVLGAILATQEGAAYGLYIGGGLVGVVGYLFGASYGRLVGRASRIRGGRLAGGIIGFLAGALLGGGIGLLMIAFLGSIPGAIACSLLGSLLKRFKVRPFGEPFWALLGACAGALALALYHDRDQAVSGALQGAVICGIAVSVAIPMLVLVFGLMPVERQ